MNERIRELETQAFDAVWDLEKDLFGPPTHFRPDGFEAKFAELIVQECMAIAREEEGHSPFKGPVETKIKQQFGVE